MADSTPTNHTPLVSESSSFLPTVSLYDWWLVKAENDFQGKCLAVAGVSTKKKGAVRVFVSAPIVKRYDVFSLETSDGVHVILSGFINEQHTLENGFAPKVFNSFLFGFPPNWESYALGCLGEETIAGTDPDNAVMEKDESVPSSDKDEAVPSSDNEFESEAGADPGNAFKDNDECMPSSDNEPTVCPEIISESYALGCLGEETKAGTHSDNAVVDMDESVPSSVNEFELEAGDEPGNAFKDKDKDECMPSSDNEPAVCPEFIYDSKYLDGGCEENPTSTSSVLPEEAPVECEKPTPKDDCNFSKMSGVSVAYDSGRNRRSARLNNIDVKECQQKKKPTAGSPPKHLEKDQRSTSVALENLDGGLESPSTPIQSQSKRPLNKLSEKLVRKCSSRISRTSSAKIEGCYKKKARIVDTKVVTPMRKIKKPASSVKSPRERDLNISNKESKQKTSLVSLESLNLKKSRSGRLLLPPLEFWRNQIPIYDANHEVTEIQEGKSLASSCRSTPATLDSRSSNKKGKRAA